MRHVCELLVMRFVACARHVPTSLRRWLGWRSLPHGRLKARLLTALCAPWAAAAPVLGADAPALPIETLVSQITGQVVQVVSAGGGFGSAVIVEGQRAVTSCHVVGPATEAYIVVGGEPQRVPLLAADRFHDLCVLSLPKLATRPEGWAHPPATCRASADLNLGETTYAVGFASGRLGYSRGKLQARYAFEGGHVLRTGAGFLPGASGGGLFDDRGRLIGVLTFIRRGGASPAYLAVPCEWVRAVLGEGGAALRAELRAESPADPRAEPFWQLIDRGSEAAPFFMQALRLEAEERWPELEALALRWQAQAAGDEAAAAALQQASRAQGRQPMTPVRTGGDAAQLTEREDAQCQSNGGRMVLLQRAAGSDDTRSLRVWVERWHLGHRTADRTRHVFTAGAEPAPLGCSRTVDGEQRWEIVETTPLDR